MPIRVFGPDFREEMLVALLDKFAKKLIQGLPEFFVHFGVRQAESAGDDFAPRVLLAMLLRYAGLHHGDMAVMFALGLLMFELFIDKLLYLPSVPLGGSVIEQFPKPSDLRALGPLVMVCGFMLYSLRQFASVNTLITHDTSLLWQP
jgi:hypothetical protein